jgi:deoxyribodipyrimidine photo-lyase
MHQPINICWFRRDLRLHDNVALYHALKNAHPVLPVFIYDTNILDDLPKKDKRVVFIRQKLKELNAQLREHSSSFFILHDTPLNAFKKICDKFNVQQVFTNHDYEPYAIKRDKIVGDYLEGQNISLHNYKDQVIFEKSEVINAQGKPYKVYTPYSNRWKEKYAKEKPTSFCSEEKLSNLLKTDPFHFPSLTEIGFEDVEIFIPEPNIDEETIRHYDETRNLPGINGTSHLSVRLRFGTLSIREMVRLAQELNYVFLNELIWREFYMMILFHFPHVVYQSFKPKYDHIQWRNNEEEFELWCKGETGYPIVDAGMRQLNKTGWMHNRVRMITASFLTKDLLIDWRWGEAYFAKKLLDYDLSANNGNWQWAAGTGVDAAPYFRIFNPSTQAKKFDPKQKYIKKWIDDFEPGYLSPIVNHKKARKRALDVYKKSLEKYKG